MLKIYGSDLSSPSNKVRFVANYLNIPYEFIRVNLRAGEQFKPEFQKVNPVGKIPAIDDNGFCLFESNAIIRYLADKENSPLYPKDLKERAIVDEWLDFGSMHVGQAISKVVYNKIFAPMRGIPIDETSMKEGFAWQERFFPVVDAQLAKHKYIVGGQITLADFNLLSAFDPAEAAGIDISKYKNIVQWRNELKSQSFYTKCYKEYGESLKQAVSKP